MRRQRFCVHNTTTNSARTPAAADVSAKNRVLSTHARDGHGHRSARRQRMLPTHSRWHFSARAAAWPRMRTVSRRRGQWDGALDEGCRVCNICRPVSGPPSVAGRRLAGLGGRGHLPRRPMPAGCARCSIDESREISRRRRRGGSNVVRRAPGPGYQSASPECGQTPARGRLVRPAARPAAGVKYRSPTTRVAEGQVCTSAPGRGLAPLRHYGLLSCL